MTPDSCMAAFGSSQKDLGSGSINGIVVKIMRRRGIACHFALPLVGMNTCPLTTAVLPAAPLFFFYTSPPPFHFPTWFLVMPFPSLAAILCGQTGPGICPCLTPLCSSVSFLTHCSWFLTPPAPLFLSTLADSCETHLPHTFTAG